jgi:signal transduction histidine kinase/PAS domain-containing protein
LKAYDVHSTTKCRLAGDYGVLHDVEMQCQEHDDGKAAVVRFREVREAAPAPKAAPPVIQPDPEALQIRDKLATAEKRLAEAQSQLDGLRTSEQQSREELKHHQWLLGTHKEVATEGVLILSAQGQVLSWNAAFLQMWKLSDETVSAHTWETIAAHMETQVHGGWDDFQRAVHPPTGGPTDSCWEMNLEGGRVLEAYSQVLSDHPGRLGALQFHFRDVTAHKALGSQLRDHHEEKDQWDKTLRQHEEHKAKHESTLREREKHLKHLEKKLRDHDDRFKELEAALREKDDHHQRLTGQLAERDQQREEMEADLRDHQDRLHDLHQAHERHADNLKAGKESMKRLANGIATDINKILSVVLGNADVLHESLPKDHLAQTYVDEIKQAANHGAELSQRLLAFSRNHLLQMVPVDLNRQLSALEPKIREALGANVQVQLDYANQELWTKTDPHPLEQALLHVLAHARQHMPQGGAMTIHTKRADLAVRDLSHADMKPGVYVELVLQDTGDGMDDETVAHVFEPYQPTKEGHKGDLTLATAYGIIRQSGGCIEVESTKGQGTAWTILLPSTTERPEALRASA